MDPFRNLALLACLALAPVLGAQSVTLSAKPLAEALKNPDLLMPQDEPRLAEARSRVRALLQNQPTDQELAGFHERLTLLARHRETRLGRLFFSAMDACPDLENVDPLDDQARVEARFPLALGSSARVCCGWVRSDKDWLISEFSVEITGNAAALFAGAAPYFARGAAATAVLEAAELDYLLGRDPAERLKLESERAPFDYDAALKQRFAVQPGAPAQLLTRLAEGLTGKQTPAEKLALLGRHMASDGARAELEKQGAGQQFWEGIQKQVQQLAQAPRPGAAPVQPGGQVAVRFVRGGAGSGWAVTRLSTGQPALQVESSREESK